MKFEQNRNNFDNKGQASAHHYAGAGLTESAIQRLLALRDDAGRKGLAAGLDVCRLGLQAFGEARSCGQCDNSRCGGRENELLHGVVSFNRTGHSVRAPYKRTGPG